jgi:hypothetical protein
MAGNRRILVGLAVLALVLTACQGGETGGGGTATSRPTSV